MAPGAGDDVLELVADRPECASAATSAGVSSDEGASRGFGSWATLVHGEFISGVDGPDPTPVGSRDLPSPPRGFFRVVLPVDPAELAGEAGRAS